MESWGAIKSYIIDSEIWVEAEAVWDGDEEAQVNIVSFIKYETIDFI